MSETVDPYELGTEVDPWVEAFKARNEVGEDKMIAAIAELIDWHTHFKTTTGGEMVSTRLPPKLVRSLDLVLVDPRVPLKTRSDAIREAVYLLLRAIQRLVMADNSALKEAMGLDGIDEMLVDEQERELRLLQTAGHLRAVLANAVVRGDTELAMIELRRYWDRVVLLPQPEQGPYLRLIQVMPVCQYVAWLMHGWPDRIADELIPATLDIEAVGMDWWADTGMADRVEVASDNLGAEMREVVDKARQQEYGYMKGWRGSQKGVLARTYEAGGNNNGAGDPGNNNEN